MIHPALSRFVFRVVGLALGGWGGVRCWVAWVLWQESGRWREIARAAAIVLGGWAAFDIVVAALLLLLKHWARYLAFVTLSLHFALGFVGYRQGSQLQPYAAALMALCASVAAMLVLSSDPAGER
jgi:hypothetical protein